MGGKIIVVPGLAVRRYAEEPAERLRQAGYEVDLRPALAWLAHVRRLWPPLDVDEALRGLAESGLNLRDVSVGPA